MNKSEGGRWVITCKHFLADPTIRHVRRYDGDVICEACDRADPPPIDDLEPISVEALRELMKPRN